MLDPERASLFYVPLLPHMSQDAGRCDGIGHRQRLSTAAAALQASPQWRRYNGTDHFWTCACVMMKSMLGNELWAMLRTSVHAVHSIPRGGASPAECLLQVPYYNPDFVGAPRAPGAERPTLAHFRGRVMNNVRAKLVKAYGGKPHHTIAAAHPNTAAKCNLNKCSPKTFAKVEEEGFPPFSVTAHFAEMTRSIFCLVPVGDSNPSPSLNPNPSPNPNPSHNLNPNPLTLTLTLTLTRCPWETQAPPPGCTSPYRPAAYPYSYRTTS